MHFGVDAANYSQTAWVNR